MYEPNVKELLTHIQPNVTNVNNGLSLCFWKILKNIRVIKTNSYFSAVKIMCF